MKFSIGFSDSSCSARSGVIHTEHGEIETPIFMPVGTLGAVKTMSPEELKSIGAQIILGNTYHLYLRPGTEIVSGAGGLHAFSNWRKPLLTDSGGFQVFSLAKLNKVTDEGVQFQSHLDGSKHLLTPEFSMKIQRELGADIIMAFDECPASDADKQTIVDAVNRTTAWIKRCKVWLNNNSEMYGHIQTLFPIVQGGIDRSLRKKSIEELVSYSECGMAIGGLAVGEEKNAMLDTIEYCDEELPKNQPRYLMGVGKPSDLLHGIRRGVDMFDCVIPSRNGRNGQVFTSEGVLNIRNERYKNDYSPISPTSSHPWGKSFSKSYLRHLFKINEVLSLRIATTLNLSYYLDLMSESRKQIENNNFYKWSQSLLSEMKNMKGM